MPKVATSAADQLPAAVNAEANLSQLAPSLAKIAPDADGHITLDRCPLASSAEILAAAPQLRVRANSDALAKVRDDQIIATYSPDHQLVVCRVVSEGLFVSAQIIGSDDVVAVINRTTGPDETEFGAQSAVLGGVMQPWHFTAIGDDYDLGFWRAAWASNGILLALGTTYESQSVPDTAEQLSVQWLEHLVPAVLDNVSAMTIASVYTKSHRCTPTSAYCPIWSGVSRVFQVARTIESDRGALCLRASALSSVAFVGVRCAPGRNAGCRSSSHASNRRH